MALNKIVCLLLGVTLLSCAQKDSHECREIVELEENEEKDFKWKQDYRVADVKKIGNKINIIIRCSCEDGDFNLYKKKIKDTLNLYADFECDSYSQKEEFMYEYCYYEPDTLSPIRIVYPHELVVYSK